MTGIQVKFTWMPDCRVNNRPGWTQGGHLVVPGARGVLLTRGDSVGSSGDVIVGHFAINYHNESLSECHTLRKLQTRRSTRQSGTSRAGKPISTNESRISFYLVLSLLTIAVPTIRRAGHIQHGANNTRRQQIPRGMRLRLHLCPFIEPSVLTSTARRLCNPPNCPSVEQDRGHSKIRQPLSGERAPYFSALIPFLIFRPYSAPEFPLLFRPLFSTLYSASYLKLHFRTTGMSGIPM